MILFIKENIFTKAAHLDDVFTLPDSLKGLVVNGLSSVREQKVLDALELLLKVVAFGLGLCSRLLLLLHEFARLFDLHNGKKIKIKIKTKLRCRKLNTVSIRYMNVHIKN